MSFPAKQFRQFTDILLNDLQTYFISDYLFIKSCGVDSGKLESVYAESFQQVFAEFSENEEILDKLKFAGKNISYAIYAYTHMSPSFHLDDILEFVDTFVYHQLNNFLKDYEIPEWSDENYESYYREKEQSLQRKKLLGESTNVRIV